MLSIDQLQQQLAKEYKLVFFGDLADTVALHGSALKLFKSLHQDYFEPNQRIVFYSSSRPSLKVLKHVQRTASRADISNWFVMFCGPHDLTADLAEANRAYGYDHNAMSYYPCEIQDTKNLADDAVYPWESMCLMPFNSLETQENLTVAPCCKYNGSIGDLTQESIVEIINNNKFQNLRDQFKQGIKPKECSTCWQVEELGSVSLRQHFLNKYQDVGELYHIDNPKIKYLNTFLGRTCNFKCRICNPSLSTAIAAEDIKFSNDPGYKESLLRYIQNGGMINFDTYLERLKPGLADLEDLHILGGEPLLAKNLIPLLDYLIEKEHNTHLSLNINTNASIWSDEVVDKLKKFCRVEVILSIDDLGGRFEIQRGGNWNTVDANIHKWVSLRSPNFIVKFSPTVNIQNVLYLDQLVEYCQKLNIEITWWYLEDPSSCCIDNMTARAKELVYNKYINYPEPELRQIAKRMLKSTPVSGNEFLTLMDMYDQRRGTNFAASHGEIVDAMKDR
jgi:MoaA/NifB/PqqE/SkfB family radical SAM enzyme